MQNRSLNTSSSSHSSSRPSIAKSPSSQDQLARIFNTALLSTQLGRKRDFTSELHELLESSAFKAILSAIRQLSRVQGVSEQQAAEEVIQTFRKLDEIWQEYTFKEGLEKLKSPRRS